MESNWNKDERNSRQKWIMIDNSSSYQNSRWYYLWKSVIWKAIEIKMKGILVKNE